MTLQQWEHNGWIVEHITSPEEISNLLDIVKRDIKDASEGMVSPDWRFGIAYNAALKLCTLLLYASGYRAARQAHHYYTIQSLTQILGENHNLNVKYLDTCRNKRNIVEYDSVGSVTENDVAELISFVKELEADGIEWLREHHPDLLE